MKKLFKIIAALLFLLVIATLAIPFFISADTLKTRVAAELSKATGRSITIDGNASLKLFPDIAVSLEKVTLGNPEGTFATKRMFYAGKLDTGVRLMPLLHKEIIITGVTLNGAEINLEENKAGAKNWEFASKAGSDTKQKKTAEEGKSSKFAIGDIAVNDSVLTYRTPGAKPVELKNIDLTVSGADGSEPLAIDGSADYRGDTATLSLDVKDSRGFLKGSESSISADIALPGGKITFDGKAKKAADISASGNLDVDVASLPALMKWATGKAAADTMPKKLALSGPVSVNGKRISFSKLTAHADDISATGKLAINAEGAVPAISGNLQLGAIDTATFSSAPSAKGNEPAAGGDGWSAKPMDLSGLKAVNADLTLGIASIKSGKLELGETSLDVNLQGGQLKLGIGRMGLYGGNAKGNISLSNGGLATALNISGVQIEPLLTALNGQSRLKGTGALDLNLRGQGSSQKSIVNTLGGKAKFTFRDGAIKGINLGQFLRDARKGFLFDTPSAQTDFAALGGSFTFANGIGKTSDLAMKAPILRLSGTGTVNMPARSLNMKLMPTLVASTKGQGGKDKSGITIPLAVTGNWSNPSVTPDIGSLIEEGIKDPAALKDNLKNLKSGLKDFNSPKDIGKALLGGKTEEPAAAPATTTTPAKQPGSKEQAIEGLFKALSQ